MFAAFGCTERKAVCDTFWHLMKGRIYLSVCFLSSEAKRDFVNWLRGTIGFVIDPLAALWFRMDLERG